MDNIEWRGIREASDLYEVSSNGLVRNKRTGRILTNCLAGVKRDRLYVHLSLQDSDGKKHKVNRLIHRLVAEAFIPNPDCKPVIDHIDGNSLNNDVSNLRWCTPVENCNNPITLARLRATQASPEIRQKYKHMHANPTWRKRQRTAHEKYGIPVLDLATGLPYPSQKAAAREIGVRPCAVGASCKRDQQGCRKNKTSRPGKAAIHFKYITKEEYNARLAALKGGSGIR